MKNIFTVDFEDWYHGNFLSDEDNILKNPEDRIIQSTEILLSLLKDSMSTATFFVLGEIAEKYPELIKEIQNCGHEIASHGYQHKFAYKRTKESFYEDLRKSKDIIENIIQTPVLGFRAPYWSIDINLKWMWETIIENGFIYDSSVYPFKTHIYGNNTAKRFQHDVIIDNLVLHEIPATVLEIIGRRVPFFGGFYFRALPYYVLNQGLKRINNTAKKPGIFYIHPWELDPEKPISSTGFFNNFILRYNIKNTKIKLQKLLSNSEYVSIREYYNY